METQRREVGLSCSGGGVSLGAERAIRKERQTQTDRDQRKAIYAQTESTTPLDNDRLRSSIKECLDDATEKKKIARLFKDLSNHFLSVSE